MEIFLQKKDFLGKKINGRKLEGNIFEKGTSSWQKNHRKKGGFIYLPKEDLLGKKIIEKGEWKIYSSKIWRKDIF